MFGEQTFAQLRTGLRQQKTAIHFKTAENCYTLLDSRKLTPDTGTLHDIDFVWALGLMPSETLFDALAQSEGQKNPFAAAMLCDTGRSRVVCEVRWR